jgi:DNA-binding MarR family transcriptional regulator
VKTLSAVDPELAHTVRIAVMRLSRRLRNRGGDSSLTLSQISALATLDRLGPLTPGGLAELEMVQPPSMTRLLAVLEERGLIVSAPHPADGRQKLVRVTPVAHRMLVADRAEREAWLVRRMTTLTDRELATLRAAAPILEKLTREGED